MPRPKAFEKPLGMKDYLPDTVEQKRRLEIALQEVMEQWGYREIITPTLEFYDTVGGASPTLEDKMFKLLDKEGHTLVLRPDMTAPIARVVASLEEPLYPLRYLYHASVYRAQENEAGRSAEFYQTGVELIGEGTPAADAEVVALALHCLQKAGVASYRLSLGHVGFLDSVLAQTLQNDEGVALLKEDLLRRDYVGYRHHVHQLSTQHHLDQEKEAGLLKLLQLRGPRDTLSLAEELVMSEDSSVALEHLQEIWRLLDFYGVAQQVILDLSMLSSLNIYTGAVFEGYAADFGFPVLSGGRYDGLLRRFSANAPAVGFALKIDRLMEVAQIPAVRRRRIVVAYPLPQSEEAISCARTLRMHEPESSVELVQLPEGMAEAEREAFEEKQKTKRNVSRVFFVSP